MDKEIEETTQENPVEEDTTETSEDETEEETSEEEQETSEKPEATSKELEKKNKRLYARMKKAEEDAKLAKDEVEKGKEKKAPDTSTDVFDLAKTVSTLKEYSPKELDFLQKISKIDGISPQEAAETEEAKLYIAALREKVAKESQTPEPSTKQSFSKKSIDKITPDDVSKMNQKEKEDYLTKTGWLVPPKKWSHQG